MRNQSARRSLALASALYLVCAASVFAIDRTSVGAIQAHPNTFHRKVVTLKGTVKGVVQNMGHDGTNHVVCVQDFSLDDGTGTIPVQYIARCEMGDEKVIKVHEGDRVVVTATVDAPSENVKSDTGEKFALKAMATKITKSKK